VSIGQREQQGLLLPIEDALPMEAKLTTKAA
jgi:hypothetical protein